MKREIARNQKIPEFTREVVDLLTDLCFRADDYDHNLDILFVFSTSHEPEKAAHIVNRVVANHIVTTTILTGGIPTFSDLIVTQAEYRNVLDLLDEVTKQRTNILYEDQSTNTYHNVEMGLGLVENPDSIQQLGFISKSHATGRSYLTLKKYLPETCDIFQYSYDVKYGDDHEPVSHETWHKSEFWRGRVWGEFLRIEEYGIRGDIAYPDEVKSYVTKIREFATMANG